MHEQAHDLVMPVVQTEEHAYAHVVQTALQHAAVHGLGMPFVIGLGAAHVHELVGGLVVGFLKKNIGAESGILESAVIFRRGGGDVHVHAADGAVAQLRIVNGVHALENVLDGTVAVVLAGLEKKTLVTELLEGEHLLTELLLRKLAAHRFVACVKAAVAAVVDAVVRKIQRREHHDAASVDVLLDLACQRVDIVQRLLVVHIQKHGRLAMRESAVLAGLVQNAGHLVPVGRSFSALFQRLQNFGVVDELVGVP